MSATTRFSILLALFFGQLFVNTIALGAKTPFTPSLEAAFSCNLPAPSNLVVTNVTTNSISVDWDDVPGAIGYYVIATNAQTGQTYYTGTPTASSDIATGLPSGTLIKVSVCAICNTGQRSGNYSNVTAQTEFIIVDDLVTNYPSTNPPINPCQDVFQFPACFQLEYDNTITRTYFKVTTNNNELEVRHVNQDPSGALGKFTYEGGWYFADGGGEPPFENRGRTTNNVLVYHLSSSSSSLGNPVFSFYPDMAPIAAQDGFKICYPSSYTGTFSIRPATCSNSGSKPTPTQDPSASETLQAYPNPFKNVLEVALGEAGTQETRLDLMDVNGRLVRTETVEAGTYSVSIETRDLAPGVYVLRCQSAAASKTLKVIKQ